MKFLYPLAKRFIAGYDFKSAKPKIKRLMDQGYEVSIDYVGELSKTHEDTLEAKRQYVDIINFYRDVKIDVSIKPTQLGLNINPYISYKNIQEIAKLAKKFGHTIRLDMEDATVTELTRNLAVSLNKKYGNVGVAIQANLHRTPEDLKHLIEHDVSVRLVKGAYKENAKIAHQKRVDINTAFFDRAVTLAVGLSFGMYENRPALGTHDEDLLKEVIEILPDPKQFDYEFLYGVRRDIQKRLKKEGKTVRIYVPFGVNWLPYCLRRLREFKNLTFIMKNILSEWARSVSDFYSDGRDDDDASVKIINNFLTQGDFEKVVSSASDLGRQTLVINEAEPLMGLDSIVGKNKDKIIEAAKLLNTPAQQIFDPNATKNLKMDTMIYRFEGKKTFLHHDKHRRPEREWACVFYLEEPEEGGEIVFPYYDSSGGATHNIATDKCTQRFANKKYVIADQDLNNFIIDNKNKLLSVKPAPNLALIIETTDPRSWHYVCPVIKGTRSAIAMFWARGEGGLTREGGSMKSATGNNNEKMVEPNI